MPCAGRRRMHGVPEPQEALQGTRKTLRVCLFCLPSGLENQAAFENRSKAGKCELACYLLRRVSRAAFGSLSEAAL